MTTSTIRAGWNKFFHEPIPATTLGLYRILFGAMVLAFCLLISSDLLVWYGDKGVLPLAESKNIPAGKSLNLLHLLPNTDASVRGFFALLVAAAFCVMIGFQTRIASIITYLTLVSFHHRNMMPLHSGDYFLRIASFWMMFADSGRAFSVDRLIRVARGKESQQTPFVTPWPMRMIQLQVCMLYFDAFLWKIRGETWINGLAIYWSSRLVEFYRFPMPYLFEHLWTIKLMTWTTLVVEGALGFLLWIKDLRYWILLAGVLLHFGIDWTMNIPLFSPIMMCAYLTWVAPEDLEKFFAWAREKVNRYTHFTNPIPVFYDGTCGFCGRSVNVMKRLDSLQRIRFIDMHSSAAMAEFPDLDLDRGASEMLLRDRDGKWFGGFDAYRVMAKQMPIFWAIWPLLFVPPAPAIGRRIYARIAGRRLCILPQVSQPQSAILSNS